VAADVAPRGLKQIRGMDGTEPVTDHSVEHPGASTAESDNTTVRAMTIRSHGRDRLGWRPTLDLGAPCSGCGSTLG
jgi:hypothetical protein